MSSSNFNFDNRVFFLGSSRLGIEPKTPGWLVQDPTTRPMGDLIPTIRGSGAHPGRGWDLVQDPTTSPSGDLCLCPVCVFFCVCPARILEIRLEHAHVVETPVFSLSFLALSRRTLRPPWAGWPGGNDGRCVIIACWRAPLLPRAAARHDRSHT